MRLEWLGHACFLVTSDQGTRILTDPYEPGYGKIISYGKIDREVDVVTISHEHGDHNGVSAVPGQPQVVRGEGARELAGIAFEGIPCYHDRVEGRERGKNTVMVFTVDGIRVAHLGDLGHPLTDEQVAKLGSVDVLLAPVGGPIATLEIDEVSELCRQINPRVVVPMHFRNDRCNFPKYGVADFTRGRPNVEVRDDSQLALSKDDLPSATKVIVLQHSM